MKKNKTIWHFSDTHTFHDMMKVPKADIAIFSGDCSNPRESLPNSIEVLKFLKWFGSLDIEYKIFVAGNHDTSIERKIITQWDFIDNNIIHLWDQQAVIEGIKIYGSPYTPTFGTGWAFNKDRGNIYKVWNNIPDNADIVVTHGPPKGILDLSYNRDNALEFCGDLALKKRLKIIQPKLVCFGHIHNCDNITNQGYTKLSDHQTIYSNGSIVTDGRFGQINNSGNVFEL